MNEVCTALGPVEALSEACSIVLSRRCAGCDPGLMGGCPRAADLEDYAAQRMESNSGASADLVPTREC